MQAVAQLLCPHDCQIPHAVRQILRQILSLNRKKRHFDFGGKCGDV